MNIIIKTNYNDTEIVGEIIKLHEFQIRVAITSPYINWESGSSINGPGRQSKNNFLHRYEEASKFLLIETYRKLAIIDKNLDRMCGLYDRLIEENKELKKLPESELRESISRKGSVN